MSLFSRYFSLLFFFAFITSVANSAYPLQGTWELTALGCQNEDGTFSRSTAASIFNMVISSEFTFSQDSEFILKTSVPLTCTITMVGQYFLDENDELALGVTSATAEDGSVFSCPGSNQAKTGDINHTIQFLSKSQFYLEDVQGLNGESRCENGKTPVQLFTKKNI